MEHIKLDHALNSFNLAPALLCLPLLVYVAYQRFFGPLASIPGPPLASITNVWYAITVRKGNVHETLPDLHRKYGPLVRIAPNELTISDPEAARRIYAPGSGYRKSKWYSVWQGRRKFDLFGEQDEKVHGKQRALVSAIYSMKSIDDLEKYIDVAVVHFLQRMEERRSASIDMGQWLQFFAFDVIGEVTFSKPFGLMDVGDQDGSLSTISAALTSGSWIGQIPWLYWLDDFLSPLFGHCAALQARNGSIRAFVMREVAARKDRGSDHDDILGKLFAVHAQKPAELDDAAVISMCASNVFAGSDSTAATARALVYFVLKDPECERRLIHELLDARRVGRLSGDVVRRREAEQLPYFMACLYETYRLFPQPALGLPRVVPEGGLEVNGKFIPQGTVVGCSPWVLHKNQDIFGLDAEHFNPDRWLKGDVPAMQRHILTFGQGSRGCIGRNLAETEIKKLIPTLFLRYELQFADPSKDWTVHSWWFAFQTGLHLKLTPRVHSA